MTNYKATSEQWEVQEKFAPESEDACCLLELRSRIERLELGAGIYDAVIKTLKSPTSTVLSPAAQAVLDDYGDFEAANTDAMAAALRAVADHVVPLELHPRFYEDCCQYSEVQTRARIRAELLAIADELEQLDE